MRKSVVKMRVGNLRTSTFAVFLVTIAMIVFLGTLLFSVQGLRAQGLCPSGEPDVELAKLWWPEQRSVWTPVSWKDHYFKFNVLYNGMLICQPAPWGRWAFRRGAEPWQGQDFMLTFRASADGQPMPFPASPVATWTLDGGQGIQGWTKGHETPVLWTEYRSQAGIVLKSEVFAHITCNEDVVTSLEPHYAWVRLSVSHVDGNLRPETFPMSVQLTRYHLGMGNYGYLVGLFINPALAPYPNKLTSETYSDQGRTGYRITEPDKKVRMIVLPTEEGRHVSFDELSEGIYNLKVTFHGVVGDYVDLLVPMLPQPREEIEQELAFGYDEALAMSDKYWSCTPESAATFHVPEKFITEAVTQQIKFAPVVAELNYITKEYSHMTAALGYDALWTTPASMMNYMFIDQMGYFDMTEKYSEIFYKNQGTVKPPGDTYQLHPGYFSTPEAFRSIDWLTDHGAVMQQLATHGLLTGDREFIDRWTGPLEKACDFIVEYSAKTDHDGIEGLLPPAIATDESIQVQAVWNLAWNYKGMLTTVRLFEKIGHPKAAEYRAFLNRFKETFVREYRKLAEVGARWTDSQGRERYMPPMNMPPQSMKYGTHVFYQDCGPLVLVWAELMEPDDPLMVDTIDFFREGPNWKLSTSFRSNGISHNAVDGSLLIHEMATCEPGYSWNVFHTWKLGDRQKFLTGMYSLMVGAQSHNTYISCEHRHAVQGGVMSFALAFYLAKLAVIDDQISYGDLHLMRLCPHAWISSEEETRFENVPTEFGPVNLKFRRSADGKTLNVSFSAHWRDKPRKIIFHAPQMPGLETIVVNGKPYSSVKEINLAD